MKFIVLTGLVLSASAIHADEVAPPTLSVPSAVSPSDACLNGDIDFSLRRQFPAVTPDQGDLAMCSNESAASLVGAALYRESGRHHQLSAEYSVCRADAHVTEATHRKMLELLRHESAGHYIASLRDETGAFGKILEAGSLVEDEPALRNSLRTLIRSLTQRAKAGQLRSAQDVCTTAASGIQSCVKAGSLKILPDSLAGFRAGALQSREEGDRNYDAFTTVSAFEDTESVLKLIRDYRTQLPAPRRNAFDKITDVGGLMGTLFPKKNENSEPLAGEIIRLLMASPRVSGGVAMLLKEFGNAGELATHIESLKADHDKFKEAVTEQNRALKRALLRYLCAGVPLAVAVELPLGFEASDADSPRKYRPIQGAKGGHSLVLDGVETDPQTHEKYFTFMNSWGEKQSQVRMSIDEAMRFGTIDLVLTPRDRARFAKPGAAENAAAAAH